MSFTVVNFKILKTISKEQFSTYNTAKEDRYIIY